MWVLGGMLVLASFTLVTYFAQSPNNCTKQNELESNKTRIMVLVFEWYVIRCENWHQKDISLKRDWNTWSKHANHFKLNSKHWLRRALHVRPLNEQIDLQFDYA